MIIWNTDVNAPCCPGEIVDDETGRTVLVQTDWDCPGTASTFGWSVANVQECSGCGHIYTGDMNAGESRLCAECGQPFTLCDHDGTDGTVDCPKCGLAAGDFIAAAGEWLEDNDGATVDDPGYFFE